MESIKEESVAFIFNVEVDVEAMQAERAARAELAELQDTEAEDILVPGEPVAEVQDRVQDRPALRAKGLSGESRPQRLSYSAPTIDGDDEVAVRTEEGDASGLEYAGTPRNAVCPCGSGKKYKRCHGDPLSDVYK
jgi:preprotein translocase subunit SecA